MRLGLLAAALILLPLGVRAQQLDLAHGGPINITASEGIEWRQADHQVIAIGDARAVRGNVTVTADRLIAWYRKKAGADATQPAAAPAPAQNSAGIAGDADTGGNEIYRMQAEGNVHIFTQTDQAWGDRAIYDLDQAVLVMTGHALKLTTPNDIVTARDSLEYWSQKHMAVGRGNAVVVTNDGRRIAADTLVAYTTESQTPQPNATAGGTPGAATPVAANPVAATPVAATQVAAKPGAPSATDDPLAASGKLQRVEAFGHVSVRTTTDTVTGDRAVYVEDTGMARVGGDVRITRGQNQLNGAEADVNMKTGIARLVSTNAGRVHGLVVPNDASNQALTGTPPSGSPQSGSSSSGSPSSASPRSGSPVSGSSSASVSPQTPQAAGDKK